MSQTSADWLQAQADRSLDRQRAQADTAKLVSTFVAAIAASLVATALQVGPPGGLDIAATCLLALAVLSTICVVLFDRLTEPNHRLVLERAAINQWDDEKLVKELREAAQTAVHINEGVLVLVRWTLAVQLVLSTVTGVLAAISLLGG
jgi:hypothetical protein